MERGDNVRRILRCMDVSGMTSAHCDVYRTSYDERRCRISLENAEVCIREIYEKENKHHPRKQVPLLLEWE